jgi:hypothetical protein
MIVHVLVYTGKYLYLSNIIVKYAGRPQKREGVGVEVGGMGEGKPKDTNY